MKKVLQLLVIFSILMIGFSQDANAQRKKKKKKKDVDEYFDDRGGFKDRLWYGGSFNLGGGSNSNFTSFQFGISPMVGYKITNFLSIGPRLSLDLNYLKGNTITLEGFLNNQAVSGGRQADWIASLSGGIFARAKFTQALFVHGEFGYQQSKFASSTFVVGEPQPFLIYDENTDKLVTIADNRASTLLGLGYNASSGGFGYEFLFLYDFNVSEEDDALPFDFRVGFTYKF